ncbi:amidase [Bradyrhizobium diazoefficiens]|nr:amidase [Bradyrhizobium diazoefficiens]QQO24174.1 amidase [Bradyrhizobium diazoefficiens]
MAEASTLSDTIGSLRDGTISALDVTESCLARIAEVDPRIEAWAFLDPDHARAQARALDEARANGRPMGPLHGIPVGVKDIFDTGDMPTEDGTVLHAGRRPRHDCTAVALLRQAGAVIMGKTVTTELALFTPGKTRHPHDPARTPGGSSSGSAAAVGSGMVPLAIGSQTNGSVIRPASFCGVVGYKPTHGLISRKGVLPLSRTLDHVGVFAGSVLDAALIAEAMMAYDPQDADMVLQSRAELSRVAAEEPPLPPTFAFAKTPVWSSAEESTQLAFAQLVDALGENVTEVELPSVFENAIELHRTIQDAELAVSYAPEYDNGRDRLSPRLCRIIEHGQQVLAADYIRAIARIPLLNLALDDIFNRYDAILTPAAPGEAPSGLETTGNPIFCTTWTLLGTPAITVPLLHGPNGMPVGIQLVGLRGNDARLLRSARWLSEFVAQQV